MTLKTQLDGKTLARGAALLALLAATGASAAAADEAKAAAQAGMRSYRTLALTPDGSRVAAVESVDGEPKAGPRIVVRATAGGAIASTYQHTGCPQCRLDALTWSPDQKALAAILTDAQAGTAALVVLRDGAL